MRRFTPIRKAALGALLVLVLGASPSAAKEQDDRRPLDWGRPFTIAFDMLIVRPIGIVRVAVGAATFVPMGAAASIGGRQNFDDAYESLIAAPIDFTFARPVGDFD